MAVLKKMVTVYLCERCDHEWIPRKQPEVLGKPTEDERPTACAKCKSPYWNKPRAAKGKRT